MQLQDIKKSPLLPSGSGIAQSSKEHSIGYVKIFSKNWVPIGKSKKFIVRWLTIG